MPLAFPWCNKYFSFSVSNSTPAAPHYSLVPEREDMSIAYQLLLGQDAAPVATWFDEFAELAGLASEQGAGAGPAKGKGGRRGRKAKEVGAGVGSSVWMGG